MLIGLCISKNLALLTSGDGCLDKFVQTSTSVHICVGIEREGIILSSRHLGADSFYRRENSKPFIYDTLSALKPTLYIQLVFARGSGRQKLLSGHRPSIHVWPSPCYASTSETHPDIRNGPRNHTPIAAKLSTMPMETSGGNPPPPHRSPKSSPPPAGCTS